MSLSFILFLCQALYFAVFPSPNIWFSFWLYICLFLSLSIYFISNPIIFFSPNLITFLLFFSFSRRGVFRMGEGFLQNFLYIYKDSCYIITIYHTLNHLLTLLNTYTLFLSLYLIFFLSFTPLILKKNTQTLNYKHLDVRTHHEISPKKGRVLKNLGFS